MASEVGGDVLTLRWFHIGVVGMKKPGMPICYVTLRNVHRLQNGFSTFLCLEWRSAEIKWRRAWAVTERPKRLYFSLFSGRKTQGSISRSKTRMKEAAAAQNCQSQILIHFSRSILPKNERVFSKVWENRIEKLKMKMCELWFCKKCEARATSKFAEWKNVGFVYKNTTGGCKQKKGPVHCNM